MMAKSWLNLVLASVFISSMFFTSSYAQTCRSQALPGNRAFTSCNDLPVLDSYLHWSFDSSTGRLQIAYRRQNIPPSRWVAWAINPTAKGMIGSQAIVAYRESNGNMKVYTAPVTGYDTKLQEGKLSFDVSGLSGTYEGNEMTIFATLVLSGNITTVNQVWQDGPLSAGSPSMHPMTGPNVQSMGSVNLLSGESGSTAGGIDSRTKNRNIHGVLNAVSWGVLMPLGAIIARYVKVFQYADPAWFYLHVACQSSAYIVGVAGWGTGLKLGSDSQGIQYSTHRTIGIVLFCLGTLQVFALLLRPKKDHKFRIYWNAYHHAVGYAVLSLSIVNIFKGLDILNPAKKWKHAYIGVIATLGGIAVLLEAFTWYVVLKRKKNQNHIKMPHGANGANGQTV